MSPGSLRSGRGRDGEDTGITNRRPKILFIMSQDMRRILVLVWVAGLAVPLPAEPLTLALDGTTDYAIVVAADASGVERYAASELALYLGQITNAEFSVSSVDGAAGADPLPAEAGHRDAKHFLFVGLSAAARAGLGEPDPLAGAADQTHVWRSHGRDIFLYGAGAHGTLYAVIAFIEDQLGWRWFSLHEPPLLPDTPKVVLRPFARQREVSFRYCSLEFQRSADFLYQMGANLYVDQTVRDAVRRDPEYPSRRDRAFVSAIREVDHGAGNHHTLFSFIPPHPDHRFAAIFDWQEKKNYFETHPAFFSQWHDGQRVTNRQLCLSNPELRAELTRQVLRFIEVEQAREGIDVVSVTALDHTGAFCLCDGCRGLEARYQSPGGPLYDYLIALCDTLRVAHPGVNVGTIAYRRSQTQIPPTLPDGGKLPPNLMVSFAPIEDNLFADWTHPDADMQATYRDLKAWGALLEEGNLLSIFYGPWGAASYLPFWDKDRLVNSLRLMHAAGVRGVHLDSAATHNPAPFYELRRYLFFKLRQDLKADPTPITREFTDFMYGPAAEMIRGYLAELEAARKAMIAEGLPRGVAFSAAREPVNFPYLTVENLHRWQGDFGRMTALVAEGPANCRINVALARRALDIATLWKWFPLQEAYPGAYPDHEAVVARIEAANAAQPPATPEWESRRAVRPDGLAGITRDWHRHPLGGEGLVRDLTHVIRGGGRARPLPPPLADLPPERVRRFVPENRFSVTGAGYPPMGDRIVPDPEAAFGFAATTYLPPQHPRQKLPFTFGCRPSRTAESVTRSVGRGEIVPGGYRLYQVPGVVTPTLDTEVWMPAWSSSTQLQIGSRLFEPGADNQWEIYVSLKFDGPTYGGSAEEDRVWCDQVIAVRIGKGQFEAP